MEKKETKDKKMQEAKEDDKKVADKWAEEYEALQAEFEDEIFYDERDRRYFGKHSHHDH